MQEKIVPINISKNEAWKLLDAIKSYQKDYALTGPTNKIFCDRNDSRYIQDI